MLVRVRSAMHTGLGFMALSSLEANLRRFVVSLQTCEAALDPRGGLFLFRTRFRKARKVTPGGPGTRAHRVVSTDWFDSITFCRRFDSCEM